MKWYRNKILSKLFLVTDEWNVAWKKKGEEKYNIIKNPLNFWLADSLIYLDKVSNKTFLFVEAFNKRRKKGEIAVLEYQKNTFENFRIVLSENYHLSYPNVFYYNGNHYMIPESSENNSIDLYIALEFPNKWKKNKIILEGKYVDTSIIKIEKNLFELYTYNIIKNTAYLLEWNIETNKTIVKRNIKDELNTLRSAGNAILKEKKIFQPIQYNRYLYGEAIIFIDLKNEEKRYKILPIDIKNSKNYKYRRSHTYSCIENIEVIDLSDFHFDFFKILKKLINSFKIF